MENMYLPSPVMKLFFTENIEIIVEFIFLSVAILIF